MTKGELRLRIKTLIPKDERVRLAESRRICHRIMQSGAYKKAPLILAYMAMPDELDLSLVIDDALRRKKKVGLPRIIPGSGLMDFYCVDDPAKTQAEASYGIKEPKADDEKLIRPEALPQGTLILVPGRAFTTAGGRLGRGKGFYDLWLSRLPRAAQADAQEAASAKPGKKNRAHLCGVCFPQQIAENIPLDEHDILMDSIFF